MNPIARFEDELLHLGIPPFGLVSEMNTRFQQFFYANTDHKFPLVKNSRDNQRRANHPAEHGIDFDVVLAAVIT